MSKRDEESTQTDARLGRLRHGHGADADSLGGEALKKTGLYLQQDIGTWQTLPYLSALFPALENVQNRNLHRQIHENFPLKMAVHDTCYNAWAPPRQPLDLFGCPSV